MRKRSLPFALVILVALAALVAAAVGGYWVWWAGQLARGIAQWREQQERLGYDISYDGPAINGFPLAHVARFDAPSMRSPSGALWRGPVVVLRSPLWDPRRIEVAFAGRHRLEHLNAGRVDSLILDGRDAEGVVRLKGDGRLESADARLRGLEILAAPFGRFAGDEVRLRLAPDYEPETGAGLGYAFSLETSALQLPAGLAAPLDPMAERIAAAGRLDGVIPPLAPRLALAAWRDNGGALDLERVEVDWPPLAVSASGRLTLDEAFRPQGQLAAHIAGLPELLDRLAKQGLMTAEQVRATKLALLAFAVERDAKDRPVVAAPVILRAGVLYLGPLPLARISPVL